VLSFGAREAQQAVAETIPTAEPSSFWHLASGVAAAGISGVAYSILGVVIRYGVKGQASRSVTLLTVGVIGVLSLGSMSLWRIGWDGMWMTTRQDLVLMLMAGLCNAAAFLALASALKITSVVYVNGLNATQAAMAAIAGVVLFQEALSGQLTLGIVLTVIGLVLMKRGL
jgi:drug/metabolite transporter (DMT)-like permease